MGNDPVRLVSYQIKLKKTPVYFRRYYNILSYILYNKVTVSVCVCVCVCVRLRPFLYEFGVVLKSKYFRQISDSECTSTNKSCPQGLEFRERKQPEILVNIK